MARNEAHSLLVIQDCCLFAMGHGRLLVDRHGLPGVWYRRVDGVTRACRLRRGMHTYIYTHAASLWRKRETIKVTRAPESRRGRRHLYLSPSWLSVLSDLTRLFAEEIAAWRASCTPYYPASTASTTRRSSRLDVISECSATRDP